ncbi:MAG: hypothetical protein R8G66_17990 [Cytophagales bacterium]|nr:hypothetical protein [Cytophagales bacterium]
MKNVITLFFLFSTLICVGQVELKDVSGYGQKKFKDAPKKMYIASFRVIYQMLFSQQEVAKGGREFGGGYRGDAVAGLNMALKGLESSDIQGLTDEIYQEFLEQLRAEGYEMISIDDAQQSEEFEGYERKAGGTLNEAQFAGLVSAVPTGFEYMIKRTTGKGKEKNRFNGYRLSSELDGAIVSTVTVVVPFVEDAESGLSKNLSKAVGGVAKIVVKPNLRIENESMGSAGAFSLDAAQTKATFYFAEKKIKPLAYTNMHLKKDVDIPGIIEEKKYKAAESAQTDNWGSSYGALKVFNVSDAFMEKTYPIEVEATAYCGAVKSAVNDYLSASLDNLLSYVNK